MQKFSDAKKYLNAAAAIDPNDPEIRLNLGFVYAKLKKYGDAEVEFTAAAALSPHAPLILSLLGWLYLEKNDRGAAIKMYKVVLPLDSEMAKDLYDRIYRGKVVTLRNVPTRSTGRSGN